MPCYDARDNECATCRTRQEQDNSRPNNELELVRELENKKYQVERYEAALCAIISELEKRDIADDIITQGSKSGLIDLVGFWKRHSLQDKTRLSVALHQYSEHEQAEMLVILQKKQALKQIKR